MVVLKTFAYDLTVNGIYYNWINNKTELEVCYGNSVPSYSGNITIPESVNYNGMDYPVTSIGNMAFQYSRGLISIVIPNSITIINSYAFELCTGLTSVFIPKSVSKIGSYPFLGCSGLSSITVDPGNKNYDSRNNCNAIINSSSNELILGCKNTVIPNDVTSIGQESFYGSTDLTSITIPNSVQSIGEMAFWGCEKMTNITIPNSVIQIGNWAFQKCTSLETIVIPQSVTTIGRNIVAGCNGITSIIVDSNNSYYDSRNNCNAIIETNNNKMISGCKNTIIPHGVESIGNYAFRSCTGLKSICIPSSVTNIGNAAFSGCSSLTSVTVEMKTPVEIGSDTFTNRKNATLYVPSGCKAPYEAANYWKEFKEIIEPASGECGDNLTWTYLEDTKTLTITGSGYMTDYTSSSIPWSKYRDEIQNLIINEGVKSIGEYAFSGCTGLTSLTIPNSVRGIRDRAFADCSGLTSVTIPNSVTSIGSSAFSGCSGLTSVIIPNSVASIDSYTFYGCSGLTSVTIPNSVTGIYTNAFRGCSKLTSVTIPNSVTSIGYGAFANCSGLNSVTIPNSVMSIATGENDFAVSAFYECPDLTSVTIDSNSILQRGSSLRIIFGEQVKNYIIGNSVTSIGGYAFERCSGLTSITIPNSVTSIGDFAFLDCSSLTSVTIPNSVTNIGRSVFEHCSSLTSVTIPNSVTSIGLDAFRGCSGLNSVTIPNSVTIIDNFAFYNCTGLTSITIPNSVISIGSSAFSGCSGLTSINITSGVTSIGDGAFSSCSKLTSVTIPNSVTNIGIYAFYDCSSLTSVTIPNSVTSIGDYTFFSCSGLASVAIPNSVTSIGSNAFRDCSHLTSVAIPNSVTSIGESAFNGCSSLTNVTVEMKIPVKIGSNTFTNRKNATLNVPIGCKAAYEAANYWKEFKEIIEPASGECGDNLTWTYLEDTKTLTITGSGYMTDYTSSSIPWSKYRDEIQNLIINEGVKSIGEYAFSGCTGLTSVTLPNSVTSIGKDAFQSCTDLTSVIIGNSVNNIGKNAFFNCYSLASISVASGNTTYDSRDNCNAIIKTASNTLISGCKNTIISNSITSIGDNAFTYCFGLTSVTIPSSVTSIGQSAFFACTGLTSVTIPNSVTSIGSGAFGSCSGLLSVIIPNSVKSIGGQAFDGCENLTSVNIQDIIAWCNINFGNYGANPLSSAHHLYLNGEEIKDLVIPSSVTSIYDFAFSGCSGLTSVTIHNSVKSIGNRAFTNCSGLTSVKISDVAAWCNINFENSFANPLSYAHHLYLNDEEIKDLVIPNSVTSIGDYTFFSCSGLTSVTIPNSVTNIGSQAFYECSSLSNVTVEMKTPVEIGSNTFTNRENATLYVPKGCKAAYEAADIWKDFSSIVELEEPYEIRVNEDVQAKARKGTFSIDLKNETTDLTAYQFDLTLPDGISLSVNDKGKYVVTKTSRYEDDSQTLNISKMEGNSYRFVCFSMSNEIITGTSGAILNAALTVGESVKEGTYEASMSNIVVTKTDGTQLKLNDSKFNIVVINIIKGDANGDGEVNVSDIVEIVNYIMNKPSDRFVFAAADLNEDGEINVTDIVKVVSIIMSSGSNAPRRASVAEMVDNDQLEMTCNDNQTLSLNLQNEGSYVASQFDIVLSAGQTLESIQLNSKRMENHQMIYAKTADNRYKVVIYSLNNATYKGYSGELLDIKVAGSGEVSIEDILFITAGQMEKRFSPLRRGTTGISMTTMQAEKMDIYSIDGRLVRKQAENTNGLTKGVYIVNGKKYIVR